MPVTQEETGYGTADTGASAARVPGVPVYYSNKLVSISSSNDVLTLTSDEGGPVNIDCDDGIYTRAELATELASKMNADGTLTGGAITFAVTFSTTTNKYTIDATTGHTIALTGVGSTSDAANTFGFYANATAAQTITSDSELFGNNTITFDFSANGNASEVVYAIYSNTDSKYVGSDGKADEASETWQTRANWSGGGSSGRVTIIGLTDFTDYTFKVKAKNELAVETAFCSNSSAMNTYPAIDYGTVSDSLARRVTGGNTRVQEDGVTVSTTDYTLYTSGTYGDINLTFVLENNYTTTSRVLLQYSEDNTTWATGRDFFVIDSTNKVLNFTSDQGTAAITLTEATYNTGAALATNLQTQMNANTTLTGTGTITFAVTFSTTTGKYTIDATAGHTIALSFWTTSTGGWTFGWLDDVTAAQTITSTNTRGKCPRTLTTTAAGTEHTIVWDSYYDAGESESDSTVYLRLTPYDASPSGGSAAKIETSDAFTVNNRPAQVTLLNYDTFT